MQGRESTRVLQWTGRERDRTWSVTPLVGLLLNKPVGDVARDAASFEA